MMVFVICGCLAGTFAGADLVRKQTPKEMRAQFEKHFQARRHDAILKLTEDYERFYGNSRDPGVMNDMRRAMMESGRIYEQRKMPQKALGIYMRVVEMFSRSKRNDGSEVCSALQSVIILHMFQKDYDKSLEAAMMLLEKVDKEFGVTVHTVSYCTSTLKQIRSLNRDAKMPVDPTPHLTGLEQYALSTVRKDQARRINACFRLAEFHEERGNNAKALAFYRQILRLDKDIRDKDKNYELQQAVNGVERLKNAG